MFPVPPPPPPTDRTGSRASAPLKICDSTFSYYIRIYYYNIINTATRAPRSFSDLSTPCACVCVCGMPSRIIPAPRARPGTRVLRRYYFIFTLLAGPFFFFFSLLSTVISVRVRIPPPLPTTTTTTSTKTYNDDCVDATRPSAARNETARVTRRAGLGGLGYEKRKKFQASDFIRATACSRLLKRGSRVTR